jgi:hypothetical protein
MNIVAVDENAFVSVKLVFFIVDGDLSYPLVNVDQLVIAVIVRDVLQISVFYAADVSRALNIATFVYGLQVAHLLFEYYTIYQ